MKEDEKINKNSKKWIIAVVLVIIIAAIAFAYYGGIIPTGLMTSSSVATESSKTGNQPAPATEPPKFTVTGTEAFSKNLDNVDLPHYEIVDLEGGRYSIEVLSDDPIWILVYDKAKFEQWNKDRYYGSLVVGTGCCIDGRMTTDFKDRFDINSDMPGTFYVVFEGKQKTNIKIKIIQELKW